MNPLSNWVDSKNVSMPASLSLFNEGDIITAMLKEEGGDWVIVGKFEVPFDGEIAYAGIAVVSEAEGEISYGHVLGFMTA